MCSFSFLQLFRFLCLGFLLDLLARRLAVRILLGCRLTGRLLVGTMVCLTVALFRFLQLVCVGCGQVLSSLDPSSIVQMVNTCVRNAVCAVITITCVRSAVCSGPFLFTYVRSAVCSGTFFFKDTTFLFLCLVLHDPI
jgi:hypothetical protein